MPYRWAERPEPAQTNPKYLTKGCSGKFGSGGRSEVLFPLPPFSYQTSSLTLPSHPSSPPFTGKAPALIKFGAL